MELIDGCYSGFMIAEAERRFPVRTRLDRIKGWLDEN